MDRGSARDVLPEGFQTFSLPDGAEFEVADRIAGLIRVIAAFLPMAAPRQRNALETNAYCTVEPVESARRAWNVWT
jgi:hypothetical protein